MILSDVEGAAVAEQPELTRINNDDDDVIDLLKIDVKMEPKLLNLQFPRADEGTYKCVSSYNNYFDYHICNWKYSTL